jgi:hypothetical protein
MKIKFFTFLVICVIAFIYFYFYQYYFNFCIGDTFYFVSYFYIPLLVIIVSSVIYLVKFLIWKLKN